MSELTQSRQEQQPLHTFTAQLQRVVENGQSVGWEFKVSRSSFPNSEFSVGFSSSFVLDGQKYARSFESYKTFVQSLGVTEFPLSLLKYTVTSTDDFIVIRGLTETTVRVAVVDLVSRSNGNIKMTMTRPATTFRVYKDSQNTEDVVPDGFGSMFGDVGDY
jgi:hypothetical protein